MTGQAIDGMARVPKWTSQTTDPTVEANRSGCAMAAHLVGLCAAEEMCGFDSRPLQRLPL